jgi:hypothetical protein
MSGGEPPDCRVLLASGYNDVRFSDFLCGAVIS